MRKTEGKMYRIICTGDSHTWGQGAQGQFDSFDPPVCAGDLRLAPFAFRSYVNILRDAVCRATGSFVRETRGPVPSPCTLHTSAPFVRVQLAAGETECETVVLLDGEEYRRVVITPDGKPKPYRNVSFINDETRDMKITFISDGGYIYRAEEYFGSHAVINCGLGSCPTFRFTNDFAGDYLDAINPDFAVIEPCTINDWLSGETPEQYLDSLRIMIDRIVSVCRDGALMTTVSPIMGDQTAKDGSHQYDEYIAASRAAAGKCGVPVADSYAAMKSVMAKMTADEQFAFLFADRWHPNDRGHAIYADEIINSPAFKRIIG